MRPDETSHFPKTKTRLLDIVSYGNPVNPVIQNTNSVVTFIVIVNVDIYGLTMQPLGRKTMT